VTVTVIVIVTVTVTVTVTWAPLLDSTNLGFAFSSGGALDGVGRLS